MDIHPHFYILIKKIEDPQWHFHVVYKSIFIHIDDIPADLKGKDENNYDCMQSSCKRRGSNI